ncbi:MAG: hypothetical protein HZB57_02875 [Gammaproteobacteria bacterium]|nr:hypothetical protein [Gammaproteobacteria bacterium]
MAQTLFKQFPIQGAQGALIGAIPISREAVQLALEHLQFRVALKVDGCWQSLLD